MAFHKLQIIALKDEKKKILESSSSKYNLPLENVENHLNYPFFNIPKHSWVINAKLGSCFGE